MQTAAPAVPALNYAALATGALGISVALAWNEAVRRIITSAFPATDPQASARVAVIYALCVTISVVALVATVNRVSRRLSRKRAQPPGQPAGACACNQPEPSGPRRAPGGSP